MSHREYKLYGLLYVALFGLLSGIVIILGSFLLQHIQNLDAQNKIVVKELVHLEELLQDIASD